MAMRQVRVQMHIFSLETNAKKPDGSSRVIAPTSKHYNSKKYRDIGVKLHTF
jgi:hypothetical protein